MVALHSSAMAAPTKNRLYHAGPLGGGQSVVLDPESSHHLVRVLRLAAGEPLELFNGDGRRFPARLTGVDPRAALVELSEPFVADTESPLSISLAQALPGGDKMDWVIEKAVELGVCAIQPLFSSRSVLKLDAARAARRLSHWQRVVIAACMQCGRDRLPVLHPPMALGTWLTQGVGDEAAGRWLLSPGGPQGLPSAPESARSVWLLVGPEGGFSDPEEAQAIDCGWQPVRLGPRILRTETAALAAVAALQARFGDF